METEFPRLQATMISLDRIRGMVMGAAVGDALGALRELRFNNNSEYKGWMYCGQIIGSRFSPSITLAIGQVTDDTEMMITGCRSLIERGRYDRDYVTMAYIKWANSGTRCLGKNTRALLKGISTMGGYLTRYNKEFVGDSSTWTQSDGALMRCAFLALLPMYPSADSKTPIVIPKIVIGESSSSPAACSPSPSPGAYPSPTSLPPSHAMYPSYSSSPTSLPPSHAMYPSYSSSPTSLPPSHAMYPSYSPTPPSPPSSPWVEDCTITNPSPAAIDTNIVYLTVLRSILLGNTDRSSLLSIAKDTAKSPKVIEMIDIVMKGGPWTAASGATKGWCLNGLYCTLVSLKHLKSYEECMHFVVQIPNSDSDTNACIAGAVMGALLGYDAINKERFTSHNIKTVRGCDTRTGQMPRQPEYGLDDFDSLMEALFKFANK